MAVSYNLKSIEDCTFCNNPNLKAIDFGMSKELSFLHENAFGAISNGVIPEIEEFDVEGSNISILHENLLNWKNVKMLAITDTTFACNCSMAWLFNDLLSNNSIYESKLIALSHSRHLKHRFGCLGPPPTTSNHTHPYTIVEIFASCKISTSINYFWYFLVFIAFICVLLSIGIYVNRPRLENFYTQMS
uniref:Uncharacterized protein n=1 Tax=Panagrolaimus superbus TaxID=310955 RepID=A0A914Z1Y7_9BILA